MKNFTLCAVALTLLMMSCKKTITTETESSVADEPQAIAKRTCASDEVLQAQLKTDPTLRDRMARIEEFTQKAIRSGQASRLVGDTIEIPVVVHVLYNTTVQNIKDGQIRSQIDVLNEDFKNLNADRYNLPSNSFQSVASRGMKIRFVLYRTIRKYTSVKSFAVNDAMKASTTGGSNPLDPSMYLNIWVCNMSGGVLGYAQFPGGATATDGVVILYSAFGSRAKFPTGTFVSTYDLGRTGTHEVGHWLNLRHIWADDNGACTGSDLVDDTPNQGSENYGVPTYPHVSCSNTPTGDMFMNYMDYTDDRGMYMFSSGQASRAMAVFAYNGPRATMGR